MASRYNRKFEDDLVIREFKKMASQGMTRTEIAKKMGYSDQHFGLKMKKLLGIYPSVYIARLKYGQA